MIDYKSTNLEQDSVKLLRKLGYPTDSVSEILDEWADDSIELDGDCYENTDNAREDGWILVRSDDEWVHEDNLITEGRVAP